MDKKEITYTDRQCYSVEEAEILFRDKISDDNWETWLSNFANDRYAHFIDGFTEINGELFLVYGDDELLSAPFNLL
jgi:hypothetical protein